MTQVLDPVRIPQRRRTRTVHTLGPAGTDAHAEASRLFDHVAVADSFDAAVRDARESGDLALVAAGFVQKAGNRVVDLWVDLHFRNLGLMELAQVWESPTKPMCLATRPGTSSVDTIALHPATEAFADRLVPTARRQYVDAKPLAVRMAAEGLVDACIGSVDVAVACGLTVRSQFQPSMVWCLYKPCQQAS
ncbi:hypothetical protein AB0A05_27485 [Streptomyces sp. NPDC046374]|uniref:hypothetical protein n=1 Tax=Streptomyces sp. NPDC046374 TaxID=3154917 RepID=UPI0034006BAD